MIIIAYFSMTLILVVLVLMVTIYIVLQLTLPATLISLGVFDLMVSSLDVNVLYVNNGLVNNAAKINQQKIPVTIESANNRLNNIEYQNSMFDFDQVFFFFASKLKKK